MSIILVSLVAFLWFKYMIYTLLLTTKNLNHMKTIEINLYQFKELSKEAQQKAIEKNNDINVDYEWWNCTYDDALNIGLEIMSFDIYQKEIEVKLTIPLNESINKVLDEHSEDCKTYKVAKYFRECLDKINERHEEGEKSHVEIDGKEYDFDEEIENLERRYKTSISSKYLEMLETENDYLRTDEAIIETFEANEYDFTEAGEIY